MGTFQFGFAFLLGGLSVILLEVLALERFFQSVQDGISGLLQSFGFA